MDTTSTSRTKVFWTEPEKAALCRQAAVLLRELKASTKLDALNRAQELVLPANRHRRLVSLASTEWFAQGLAREEELHRSTAALEEATRQRQERHNMALPEMWPVLRERLVQEAASFLEDVLSRVNWPPHAPAELSEVMKAAVAQVVPALRTVPTTGLVSVLIVGLKGAQPEEIRRDFGKTLDLRFFGVEESKERLRSMCEQAQHSIAMTGFISHTHEEILQRRAQHYIRSSGGLTRLKELLKGLVEPARAAA